MAGWKAVRAASAASAVVLCAAALVRGDYFWLAVTALVLFALFLPEIVKSKTRVRAGMLAMTLPPSLIQISAIVFDYATGSLSTGTASFSGVPLYEYVSAFCLVLQCFFSSLVVVATFRSEGRIKLTRGWRAVVSMAAIVSASAFFMFYEYVWMHFAGYPLTNDEMLQPSDDLLVNGMLMSFPLLAVFLGAVLAYVTYKILKRWPIDELTEAVA